MKTKKETLIEIKNLLLKRQSVPWELVDDFADIINGHFNKPEKMKTNKQLQVWCMEYALKEFKFGKSHPLVDFDEVTEHAKRVYNVINEVWEREEDLSELLEKDYNYIQKLWEALKPFGVDKLFMQHEGKKTGQDPLYLAMYRLARRNLEGASKDLYLFNPLTNLEYDEGLKNQLSEIKKAKK